MEPSLREPLIPREQKATAGLHYHFLMLGAGLMVAVTTVFTAIDWIVLQFPERNVGSAVSFAISVPNIVFQPLTLYYGQRLSVNAKTIGSFVGMGVPVSVTMPFAYPSLLIISLLIGSFNAVSEVAVLGLAGMMPDSLISAMMAGNSFGGVLISVARIACLATLGDGGMHVSTAVYFTLAGVVLSLCVASQCSVMRDPFVLSRLAANKHTDDLSAFAVLCKVPDYAFLGFATFAITYAVFPTVAVATASE